MVIEKLVQKCKKQLKQRNDWYAGIKSRTSFKRKGHFYMIWPRFVDRICSELKKSNYILKFPYILITVSLKILRRLGKRVQSKSLKQS